MEFRLMPNQSEKRNYNSNLLSGIIFFFDNFVFAFLRFCVIINYLFASLPNWPLQSHQIYTFPSLEFEKMPRGWKCVNLLRFQCLVKWVVFGKGISAKHDERLSASWELKQELLKFLDQPHCILLRGALIRPPLYYLSPLLCREAPVYRTAGGIFSILRVIPTGMKFPPKNDPFNWALKSW